MLNYFNVAMILGVISALTFGIGLSSILGSSIFILSDLVAHFSIIVGSIGIFMGIILARVSVTEDEIN